MINPAPAPLTLADVNLNNPETFVPAYPHEAFRLLRREAPVYRHPAPSGEFWVISRYRDIERISLDQKTFSSARGGTLIRDYGPEEMISIREQLINMDPPRHTKFRRLVSHGFVPKVLRNLEQHVRELTAATVASVAPKGACDFVTEVAAELPLQVICELMGVPLEDRHLIFDWSNQMIAFDDPEYGGTDEAGRIAAMQMFMYANQLAEDRRANPRDDLTTVLVTGEVDGEKLNEAEFNNFFLLLLVAGNETTRNLISGGMRALCEHPDQFARLKADPSLINTAVDEMLRWVTPVNYFRRTVQRDVEVHDQLLREGEKLTLWYGSANRDEDMFTDPYTFDVGRTPNEHLAFGFGPHFCLGSHLARMEIKMMFEELLRRLPDIEIAGPVHRLRSNFINGIKHMPVTFTPA